MPSDPDFPFAPADPSQWRQTRALPHILVQPNAPPNAGSTNPAGSDGIDDWFVPTPGLSQDGFPDDWFVPGMQEASHLVRWRTNPDNSNAPAPATAPSPTPSAPNPQPGRPRHSRPFQSARAAATGPLAAYGSLIPPAASAHSPGIRRYSCLPIRSPTKTSRPRPGSRHLRFLNSPGQLPSPGPAPLDYSLPAYGLLGRTAKLAAPAPPISGRQVPRTACSAASQE